MAQCRQLAGQWTTPFERRATASRFRHTQTAANMTAPAVDLRYPVGRFDRPAGPLTAAQRDEHIAVIERAPAEYRAAVRGMTDAQLDTPYRDGGWTVRQTVHHVVDSHINSYCRFRLALTENEPVIKTYDEALWAELPDAKTLPAEVSLAMLEPLHERWAALLRGMSAADWDKSFRHPEWGNIRLDTTLALYSWHCKHHLAHITGLKERQGW